MSPPPGSSWRGRKAWIAAGVALVLAVAITFGAVWGRDAMLTARAGGTVRAYLQVLADRDPDRAGSMLVTGRATGAVPIMLTASTLRNAGYRPPSRVQVRVLRAQGVNATVAAEFDLPDGHQKLQLKLIRRGSGALPEWKISNGLLPMALPSYAGPGNRLVAGVAVSAQATSVDRVFPGAYEVSLPQSPLYEASTVNVWAGYTSASYFPLRVRSEAQAEVATAMRAYLDNCADLHAYQPTWCPVGKLSSGILDTDLEAVKVTEYPSVKLVVDDTGHLKMTSAEGRVTYSGHLSDQGRIPFNANRTFNLGGAIQAVGGKVVFTPLP